MLASPHALTALGPFYAAERGEAACEWRRAAPHHNTCRFKGTLSDTREANGICTDTDAYIGTG